MWRAKPTWGAPRIVGELHKLGMNVAKSTVETYRPKRRHPSSPTWKTFLHNYVADIVACDFFTVPTATFRVLFVFIMLAHERRRIVHSTSPHTPRHNGPPSKSSRRFPGRARRAIFYGIGTRSTVWRSSSASRTWASKK